MAAPSLEFDWELGIFRGLRHLWRSVTTEDPIADHAVFLKDYEHRLAALAQVLSGEALRIRPAQGAGGLRERDILLPTSLELGCTPLDGYSVYVVRVALSATHWRARRAHPHPGELLGWLEICASLVASTEAEWPHFAELHRQARAWELATRPALDSLRGRARVEEEARQLALSGGRPWEDARLRRAIAQARVRRGPESPSIMIWGDPIAFDVGAVDGIEVANDTRGVSPKTEREAHAFEDLRVLLLNEEDVVELPTHVFEKVETLENFNGAMRQLDGDDDLSDHAEALEEVDLRDLIRGGEQAQSVYKADIAMDIGIPDVSRISPDETGIPYDEWDFRKKRYREGWTTVYPATVPLGSPAWAVPIEATYHRTIEELFTRLHRHREALRPANRQLEGEAIDLDALIAERASARAGHGGNQRLYVRQDRRERDAATTVLIDISLSTDSYVENRRVIEVAREAVYVLGAVSERLNDQLRVLAFASHTRNQVRVWEVKGWGDTWDQGVRRLGVIEPQGYTRIGPAIRHASSDLAATSARRRLLLLISDGKPTDFDKYEGRYGVADVRRAVQEAHAEGVAVHGLAIEAVARDYLPTMLGAGSWHLLPHPERLPEVLTTIYGRLTSR